MREFSFKVDGDFSISSPNLGDGELRKITFRHPNIFLDIYVPAEVRTLSIELNTVSSFSFSTVHPQNVIEGIKVYPNQSSMPLTYKNAVAGLSSEMAQAQEGMGIVILPITGATLVCVCKTVAIFSDN